MNISLSTHLFVFYILNEEIISLIYEYGFENVEIWGMRPHFDYCDKNYIRKIKKSFKKYKINVSSFHAPMYRYVGDAAKGMWLMLSDMDEHNRKEAVGETIKLLNVAQEFEPFNFVIHPDLSTSNFTETRDNLKRSLEELREHAIKSKIKLALETGIRSSNISESVVKIVKELDESVFGICVDVGHANVGEEPVAALERCLPRLFEVHVSDNHGDGDTHLVPGEGNMNWENIIEKLKVKNFKRNFVFEIMDPVRDNTRPVSEFKPILEKLRNFRKQYGI
jgi:sugar phosphate isomerase/epimerase